MGNCCSSGSHPTAQKGADVEKVQYAFFDALPPGSQAYTVDHVYDGDTLTVVEQNRARVRLLGIDAPELAEKEPYAKEAADYVKALCPARSKIWLRVLPTERDRHKRLLAYVFVANPAADKPGYVCVNIALLQEGLASIYCADSSLEYKEQMLKAEQVAIAARANMWKRTNFQKKVFTTPNGKAFHTSECLAIQKVKPQNLQQLTAGAALGKGYSPCRECKPL